MSNLRFTVDSALLSELGEKLVESVHIALVELIKNSYDADATRVIVHFTENKKGESEIHIIDNGIGMNFSDVENYWMRIATTNKTKKNNSPYYGRPRTGSKGIGRFCCRRLGTKLMLITTGEAVLGYTGKEKKFQQTQATFMWDAFKAGTDVTEIDCPGEQSEIENGNTGTKLIIQGLVDQWTSARYSYLKRNLAVLAANRGTRRTGFKEDPGFNIIFKAKKFEEEVKDLRHELINAGWGTITAKINSQHQAVCKLEAMDIGTKHIVSSKIFPLLKDVTLKIGILVQERVQMRNTGVLSIGNLNQILPEWGGVQIRFRGFRVYPYGDDDWLEIDKDRGLRKTTPKAELFSLAQTLRGVDPSRALLNMLSMHNHIGNVNIGEKASGFEMKASREGFIHSDAFEELKLFVRYAIDWASIYRDYYLRKTALQKSILAHEELEELLEQDVEPEKVVKTAINYLGQEIKTLSTSLPEPEKKRVTKSFERASNAILRRDESNQEELRHLRLIASSSTLMLIFSHEVKSLLGGIESSASNLEIVEDKISEKEAKILSKVRLRLQESKERFKQLLEMTTLISLDSRKSKPQMLALPERLINAKECFRLILENYDIELECEKNVENNAHISSILEAELYAILLNAFSNSIKAVIAKKRGGERKINVSAFRKEGKTILRIKDNGIGLPESQYEEVFIPFVADPSGNLYTRLKENLNPQDRYIVGTGSGLGLSIIKEIVRAREGDVHFVRPRDPWRTELEVVLP